MSKLEDDISRVMAGHDDEAPRAADLLRALEQAAPPRRRSGWFVPFMVAAAVAVVVAGSAWAGEAAWACAICRTPVASGRARSPQATPRLHRAGQRLLLARDPERGLEAGVARRLEQGVDIIQRRLRHALAATGAFAQHADHLVEL